MKMSNILEGFIAMLAILALVCLRLGLPLMILWNLLIPDIFPNVANISFFQAVGLNLLCSILFKSSLTVKKDN